MSYPSLMPHLVLIRLLKLLAVLLVFGEIWVGILLVLMALALLRPRRMTDARALLKLRRLTPRDLMMEFEELTFEVPDDSTGKKLKLAAWWIPLSASPGPCAVLVHGYADAKIGAIAWAPLLRSLGFHILAIDLRAHGDSEGKYSTAGYWERHDLNHVFDRFKAERGSAITDSIFFGVSLGAVVCAAAAVSRTDLAAVVLESPFADYEHAIEHQSARLGMPGKLFQSTALRVAEWIAKCDFSAVRPTDTIPKIPCPTMLISSGDDPFVPAADIARLRDAISRREERVGPSDFWLVDRTYHIMGVAENPQEYREKLGDFLSRAIPERRLKL